MTTLRIVEYLDPRGRSPFARWFEGLNAEAAAKITAAVYQLGAGNWGNTKGVGGGIFERKVDFGPGYRIYFGKEGESLVILLGGSTKQRQQQAIEVARDRWTDYRRRNTLGKAQDGPHT
jgi:putative addiction module killer protein